MITLGSYVKTESCNTWRVWNRSRMFSPTTGAPNFIKIKLTCEPDNKIKSFKVILVANKITLPIKESLWSYYFYLLCNNIADKNVTFLQLQPVFWSLLKLNINATAKPIGINLKKKITERCLLNSFKGALLSVQNSDSKWNSDSEFGRKILLLIEEYSGLYY